MRRDSFDETWLRHNRRNVLVWDIAHVDTLMRLIKWMRYVLRHQMNEVCPQSYDIWLRAYLIHKNTRLVWCMRRDSMDETWLMHAKYNLFVRDMTHFDTGWQRLIGCLKLLVIFRKRTTNYRALLRKMTYKDKASYASSAPCTLTGLIIRFVSHIRHIRISYAWGHTSGIIRHDSFDVWDVTHWMRHDSCI